MKNKPKERTDDQNREALLDLKTWPFYWVTQTNDLYMKMLEIELKNSNLDIPSWRVLNLLGGGQARSVSYLATESIVKLNTMTRIIQRMREEELVKVRVSKRDARVTEVYLTKKGEKARAVALSHATLVMDEAFANVSLDDRDTLIATLSKVMGNMGSQR